MTTSTSAAGEFRLGGDLRINRLGLGAMRLASGGWNGGAREPETSRAVLRRAVELGVNHIDTADFYRSRDGAVSANALIREALHPYPSDLVIATKVGPVVGPGGAAEAGPDDLRSLVEGNLEALGLDRLDLVYLRIGGWGGAPHGKSLARRFEALAALREQGLIRHLGLSNIDIDHLAEARTIAPVVAVQNAFNFASPDDAGILDACADQGVAFVPYSPLSGSSRMPSDSLTRVAARHGATVSQLTLARILARSPVTLAIPGTGSIRHLEENMAARSIEIRPDDLADLA